MYHAVRLNRLNRFTMGDIFICQYQYLFIMASRIDMGDQQANLFVLDIGLFPCKQNDKRQIYCSWVHWTWRPTWLRLKLIHCTNRIDARWQMYDEDASYSLYIYVYCLSRIDFTFTVNHITNWFTFIVSVWSCKSFTELKCDFFSNALKG